MSEGEGGKSTRVVLLPAVILTPHHSLHGVIDLLKKEKKGEFESFLNGINSTLLYRVYNSYFITFRVTFGNFLVTQIFQFLANLLLSVYEIN